VTDRGWISATDFEDGIAVTNLLPGPASTQLAILCAWHLRRRLGAVIGGICFILPGLVAILALSVLFLSGHPAGWVQGAAAGAGAAIAAVALNAALGLMPASWTRIGSRWTERGRWLLYAGVGGLVAAAGSPFLVLVLLASGLTEVGIRVWSGQPRPRIRSYAALSVLASVGSVGGIGALIWEGFKVGALSYGGGFVIIPLMQADVVSVYHWLTNAQFLSSVALGQITPGPVVLTVAAVGYAAAGLGGGILAAVVAFTPSFVFILLGAPYLDRVRAQRSAQAFLTGAGAAAIGAIGGSAIPLALSLVQPWQFGVLIGALAWLVVLRRNVVIGLLAAAAIGVAASLAGVPVGA
jgi:chromate transporter